MVEAIEQLAAMLRAARCGEKTIIIPSINGERHMPKGRGKETVKDVMHKYKHGQLHSGSKTGPKVKSRKQAVAIAMSESGKSRK